ncbi:MAG: ATP-binding protein [Bacteroides sp.]|nr:ATP-binding protein [Bacteroides sp.]
MVKPEYKSRIVDSILSKKLKGMGAVLIVGPKWCGKTTSAEQQANSIIYMDNPQLRDSNIEAVSIDPNLILDGAVPRLIDEWQIAPKLWDAVRFTVDHRNEDGQFILTGSAVPLLNKDELLKTHTGTGRIGRIKMRTMSLWESGDSSGKISLEALFAGEKQSATCDTNLEKIAYLTCRGGWPRAIFQDEEISLERATDYVEAIIHSDVNRVDNSIKNPERIARLLRSFARHIGTQAANSVISTDLSSNEGSSFDVRTVQSYINVLKQIFVVEDMPAWNPNLRSKAAIRTSDTHYFVDPSIAVAALGIGPNDLILDLKTFGFIFENLCVRDLRVYAESLGGDVYHYRDNLGLECDTVVHLRNGKYGLIEIKLGGDKLIDEGVSNLLKLRDKIDTDKMNSPAFMMVLTATGNIAYQRKDGVYVVPITCLKN